MDLKEIGCGMWTGFGWYRMVSNGISCEHCHETSVSVKDGNDLTSREYQVLKDFHNVLAGILFPVFLNQ